VASSRLSPSVFVLLITERLAHQSWTIAWLVVQLTTDALIMAAMIYYLSKERQSIFTRRVTANTLLWLLLTCSPQDGPHCLQAYYLRGQHRWAQKLLGITCS
jgi:hypothetical protein